MWNSWCVALRSFDSNSALEGGLLLPTIRSPKMPRFWASALSELGCAVWLLMRPVLRLQLSNIEVAKQQNRLIDALKAGSEAVKDLQQQVLAHSLTTTVSPSANEMGC